jgi:predicted alpha/beta superfamily hydrolase
MKMRILFLIFSAFALFDFGFSLAQGQQPEKIVRIFEIPGTEIRDVHSKITGQDYELMIHLPYSYKTDTAKRYPVVYFCDGFYDFALFAMIYGEQIYDKTINECLLVGFSYKGENSDYGRLRTRDYTPASSGLVSGSGGASDVLKVVEKEFIPFIESGYRADSSFRALGGSSLGGLFTIYTMLTRPALVQCLYVNKSCRYMG